MSLKKSKILINNTLASFAVQFAAIVSSFIVPRVILSSFGSVTNGIINSITGFLGFLTLMEAGVGNVARAELYAPVANGDTKQINLVVSATQNFFRKIAGAYLLFVIVFAIIFACTTDTGNSNWFTFSLVLIIAITNIVQYYFGASYIQVLYADQKLSLLYVIQAIAYIINVAIVVVLTKIGASIHIVKLASSIVFIIRPVFVNIYVKNKYCLSIKPTKSGKVLKQKWNNMLQTVAYFVHSKTDVMVLTVFSTFQEVSVYSVYALVTTGLSSVISSLCNGFTAKLGNHYGKGEREAFENTFEQYELYVFALVTICFTTATVTIVDFLKIYTRELSDANYIRPLFGVLFVMAEAMYCLRMPYNNTVSVAGHFKQTQNAAVIEAIINILLSVTLVLKLGIIGVALGTLVAMTYRTMYLVNYLSKNILFRSKKCFFVNLLLTICVSAVSYVISKLAVGNLKPAGYVLWAVEAIITMAITGVFTGAVFTIRKKALKGFVYK